MKKFTGTLALGFLLLLPLMVELEAAARRGDGARGGGGRSPSMSRTGASLHRPVASQPGRIPSRSEAQQFINRGRPATPHPGIKPAFPTNPGFGNRPPSSFPTTISPGQKPSFPNGSLFGNHQQIQAGNRVKNYFNQGRRNNFYHFNNNFWRHPNRPYFNGWGYTPWYGIYSFLGYGNSPLYYYNGDTYPVDNATINYVESPAPPASSPSTEIPADNWLSLGVFSLTDLLGMANTNIYLQLAVNANGVIQGTFYNAALDATYPIIGYTEKDTQMALWKVESMEDSPTMETGIYNLTQSQTPVQVTFNSGQVQEWLLVRIDEPKSTE